jgi:hypothetical protein
MSRSDKVDKYRQFDSRNSKLEERESKVIEAEREQRVVNLTVQLAAEADKSAFAKQVALGLVRNTEYRKFIYDSETQTGYQGPNGWVQPTPHNKSFTENTTAQ